MNTSNTQVPHTGWNGLLFGGDSRIPERNVLWNTLGSAIYALTSMLLGAAVTRVLGADVGGIFFFAFSTFGQQMFIAAYFGMRPIQVTDTAGRHSFGDYQSFRFLTCFGALAAAAVYAFGFEKAGMARTVLLLMVLYKVLDGYADCCDSEFQRQGRLYLTGKSNAFRTLLSVGIFFAIMLGSRDLVLSCIGAVLGQAAGIVLFCLIPLQGFPALDRTVHAGSRAALFHESKWLFLSAFLDLYIFAASKYAVNRYMTSADNSYYTTIFIPTSVINLMANFVIRPVLTVLSGDRDRGDRDHFLRTVYRLAGLILGLTLLGMGAAALLGIPVLSLLVGPEAGKALQPLRGALVMVILGGGFYALLNLLYYVLVILDAMRVIFLIYCGCTLFAGAVSGVLVQKAGIPGAALAYLVTMAVLAVLFALAAALKMRSWPEKTGGTQES